MGNVAVTEELASAADLEELYQLTDSESAPEDDEDDDDDEYDEDERLIQRVAPRTFRVSGRLPIVELNAATGLTIPNDSFDTVGGWVLDLFGRVPHKGEKKEADGVRVAVEKVERTRVLEVLVTLPDAATRSEAA